MPAHAPRCLLRTPLTVAVLALACVVPLRRVCNCNCACVVCTGTWWEDKPQPVLAFAMLFVGFVFLSIEDIAVQIEEPFSILPLVKCHKWLLFEVRRMRGLVELPDEERRGRGSRKRREEEVDSSE